MTEGHAPTRRPVGARKDPPRRVCAERRFAGAQELRIDFRGQEYRLRQTRNGKLILTK